MPTRIITSLILSVVLVLSACGSPEERAQAHIESGFKHLSENKPALASLDFRNALKINDKLAPAWFGLAQVEERQGRWDKVFGLLNKVVNIDPNHLKAQVKLGKLLLLAGQLDKALETSNTTIKLDSSNAAVQALRAATLFKLEDPAGAVKHAESALETDPTNVDAITVLVAERLAAKDIPSAITYLDQGISQNEKNITLHLVKIQALDRIEKKAEAEIVFRRLIELYPEKIEFRKSLARYLLRQNRPDDAEKEMRALAADFPKDPEIQLDVVRVINATRGIEPAKAELDRLIQENPAIFRYQFAAAQILLTQSKTAESRDMLMKISKEAEDKNTRLAAKARIAEILLQEKKPKEALEVAEEVLVEDGRHVKALMLRASIRIDKRQLGDAISDLRTILKDSSQSTRALLLLARAHQLNGAIELADDRLANAFRASSSNASVGLHYVRFLMSNSRASRAEDVLTTVLAREPRNLQVLRTLAQVRLAQKNWHGAQEVAETLRKIGDKEVVADNIIGRALEGQKKFDKSIEFFQRAHDASPLALRPMVSLVRAYIRAGKKQDAKNFLQAVLESNDKNVQALLLLARVHNLEDAGKEDAEVLLKRALELEPEKVLPYRELARFLQSQKRYDEAETVVANGLAKHPDDSPLRLFRAGIYEQRGKINDAISEYEQLHRKQPDSDVFANNLASLLSDHREDPESLERAYGIAKRFRDSSIPHFKDTYGWILHRKGENERAIPLLRDVVKKAPTLPIFRYHLGMVYLSSEQNDKALAELRRTLELSKNRTFTKEGKVKELVGKLEDNMKNK